MRILKLTFLGISLIGCLVSGQIIAYADTAATQVVASPQVAAPVPPAVPVVVPAPPEFDVKGYVVMDANSGRVLIEKNSDLRLPPASLTKIMTLYLTADALKKGQIHLNEMATISENAWRTGGSKMFIKVGSSVPVEQLIDGIVIASGNDAAYAMAEFIGGNEPSFVKLMNKKAAELGMKNTNFSDSNGMPVPNHYSSPYDLAILARAWISDFPEYYPWFSKKWITFNRIKQPNRNRLLWRDPTADGIKTGHTDEAGYCLVGSAVRNNMRLIVVLMGTPSDKARFEDAEALLNYGFRYFESHKLYSAGETLTKQRVWFGSKNKIALGVTRDMYATSTIGQYKDLQANVSLDKTLEAPVTKGQVVGKVNISLGGKVVSSEPLIALEDDPEGNIIKRMIDHIAKLL